MLEEAGLENCIVRLFCSKVIQGESLSIRLPQLGVDGDFVSKIARNVAISF